MTLNREDGNNLFIKLEGQGTDLKSFSFEKADGRYAKLKNFSGTLGDLLAEIEKIGFNFRRFFNEGFSYNITLNDDMRIKALYFNAYDFGAEQMTHKEFAQAILNAYDIPDLKGTGENRWEHRNLSQGWQVRINWGNVIVEPIITQSAFD